MKIKINSIAVFLCAIAIVPPAVFAYAPIESKADAANVPMLAAVRVNASLGGPAMWRVSKDGRVMWVLGIVQIVPKKLTWQSHDIASVMTHAQELILPPKAYFRLFYLKWFWWRSAIRDASKNQDHATLADILPSAMLSRWRMLWKEYGNGRASMERFNPLYAQRKLYHVFLKKNDFQSSRSIVREITDIARKYSVRVVRADYVEHVVRPKQFLIASVQRGNELPCFSATLKFVQHDLDRIQVRANAWATGDIPALRITRLVDRSSCNPSLKLTSEYGAGNVPKHMKAVWLASVQSALKKYEATVAILPMSDVLAENGYLAALQARGYKVEPPSTR